jgi:serine protease AprX
VVKPDLVAPGNQVRSDLNLAQTNDPSGAYLFAEYPSIQVLMNYYVKNSCACLSGEYITLSGTSMATPVVSGAAALLIQQNPTLTPDQVKARLMKTAYKTFPTSSQAKDPTTGLTYIDYYDIFTIGAGYLDIGAAFSQQRSGQRTGAVPHGQL